MLLHVDGWLCEIKDVQIRDGLHVLGAGADRRAPSSTWCWPSCGPASCGAATQSLPGLRQALGLAEDGTDDRAGRRRGRGRRPAAAGRRAAGRPDWDPAAVDALTDDPQVAAILRFAATEVVPRLAGTADEIDQVLRALDGRFIAAGPSGSPLRGLVNVLPTGRNFYSVDPKAIPSRLAWETGAALADSLLDRYRDDHGDWPQSVGPVGVGHLGDAHLRRRHRRGACAARRSAGLGRRVAAGDRPRADAARQSSAGRASTSRCASPASSATPSRTSSRCSTTRCGWSPAWTSPPSRTTSARTRRPTSPSTATNDAPPHGSSAPSRAPTAPACCS